MTTLSDEVLKLGGNQTEGIFRYYDSVCRLCNGVLNFNKKNLFYGTLQFFKYTLHYGIMQSLSLNIR